MEKDPRPEKVAVVDEVKDRLSSSSATVLTEYRGLDVGQMASLRRAVTEAGGEYKIYKNTLVRFAVRELGVDLEDLLTGPNALTFVADDAASVAKALRDFANDHEALIIKGGLLGDKRLQPADIEALAKLPSRDELLSRFAGSLAAPMQQFAGLLQALPRNFAYGLAALIEQGGAGEAPETLVPSEGAASSETPVPSEGAEASSEGSPPDESGPEPATAADTNPDEDD